MLCCLLFAPPANSRNQRTAYCIVLLFNCVHAGGNVFLATVSIRETYVKDNKVLPGKKGINLSLDEFEKLIAAAPALKEKLKK